MTGMQLYARFLFTLAVGLAGLGTVLKILFDTILRDWDPVRAARAWWRRFALSRHHVDPIRAEDILMELEGKRDRRLHRRWSESPIDRRREELREAIEADRRVASPPSRPR